MENSSKLSKHLIICGFGKNSFHIAEELDSYKKQSGLSLGLGTGIVARDYLIIDTDAQAGERLKENFEYANFICGDATDDDVLDSAGLGRAFGIFTILPNDRDNLFITFSARQRNPAIKIVSRTADVFGMGAKLRKAGADSVISPNFIGGLRMASEMIRPEVTAFLDEMLRSKASDIHVREIKIRDKSPLCGASLNELGLHERFNLQVVAMIHKDDFDNCTYNPAPDTTVNASDTVVVFGKGEDITRFEETI